MFHKQIFSVNTNSKASAYPKTKQNKTKQNQAEPNTYHHSHLTLTRLLQKRKTVQCTLQVTINTDFEEIQIFRALV